MKGGFCNCLEVFDYQEVRVFISFWNFEDAVICYVLNRHDLGFMTK